MWMPASHHSSRKNIVNRSHDTGTAVSLGAPCSCFLPFTIVAMSSKVFSLAGKGLKLDTEADIDQHIQPLKDSHDFSHIDLSGNTFGVDACKALAVVLAAQKHLVSADLHDIFTSRLLEEIPPALNALLTALLSCAELHTIDLSDNAFGLKTKDPLVDFLSKHTPLQHLILNNNGMGPIAGTAIAESLSTLANRKKAAREDGRDVKDLQSVVCGRNRLENGSMAAWARAYEAHREGIMSVKMTQNGIRPEGISLLITSGLRHCSRLEVLDMQDNTFTLVGATALALAVDKWPRLKELGVGDDLLGPRGSIKLFQALENGHNKSVEILRLQFNDVNAKGVAALVGAAKEGLPSLRRVELNGNKFDEDDSKLEELTELLSDRKAEHGNGGDPDGYWGVDELDELEEEDSEEDEEDEETTAEDEQDEDKVGARVLQEADEVEDQTVSQKRDPEVDALADALKKTEI